MFNNLHNISMCTSFICICGCGHTTKCHTHYQIVRHLSSAARVAMHMGNSKIWSVYT